MNTELHDTKVGKAKAVSKNMTEQSMSRDEVTERNKATVDEQDFPKTFNDSIIDSISDDILVINPDDYTIVGSNEAVLKQLKLRKDNVVGRHCYEVTHHISSPCKPPHDICPIQELIKTGNSVSVEHTHFDKDNNKIYVEVSAHPIKNREGKIILVTHVAKDVTVRKRMQEELLKSQTLATIGELALQIANDLRNPLQAIQSATYFLKKKCVHLQSSPQGLEILQAINGSVKYADDIVKALLDFASTRAPILKKTSINTVVENALSQLEKPKNVIFVTELGHIPQIEADEDMLKRVFLNLALNGIQAMENGGTLRVSTSAAEEFVEVSFRDTGIGIPEQNLEKLFKPLFSTKSKGIGLGLAICRRLIEQHGGSIKVKSEMQKGATFTVKLPIHQPKAENRENVEPNILVVKDNSDVLESIKALM